MGDTATAVLDQQLAPRSAARDAVDAPAPPTRLESLTALRFFGAASIVAAHIQGNLGTSQAWAYPFALEQGVSFFFILSGFILTYVYPDLRGRRIPRFFVARYARILPMAAVALVVYLILVQPPVRPLLSDRPVTAVLTVLLLHGWIPIPNVYAAFNLVSWSVSTESFFYLSFPLLLWRWRSTWPIKLAVTLALVLVGIVLAATQALPALGGALTPINASFAALKTVDLSGLLYVNPLARVFEFTLGIAAANIWQALRARFVPTAALATAIEIALTLLVVVVMSRSALWANSLATLGPIGKASGFWLRVSGFNSLPIMLLIVVFAFERGLLSRALRFAPLVLLGEISYSIYLIHWPLLSFYKTHTQLFLGVPDRLLPPLFITVLLLASYASFAIVEVPCRRSIVALYDRFIDHAPPRPAPPPGVHSGAATSVRGVFASASWLRGLIALNLLLAGFYGVMRVTAAPAPPPLATLELRATPALADINWFGDQAVAFDAPRILLQRARYPGGAVVVGGWTFDREAMRLAAGAFISVDGRADYAAQYGIEREDIAGYFGVPGLVRSGYRVTIPLAALPPGEHVVTVRVLNADLRSFSESRRFLVQVSP